MLADSMLCVLRERYIVELFEGIISMPFIKSRLSQLRQIEMFENMERRKLIKVAFDLQELHLKIGTRLETEERRAGELYRYCYYIIEG